MRVRSGWAIPVAAAAAAVATAEAELGPVVLPGAAYTEKAATYVNTEGRVQMTRRAVFPPGDAREDWTIVRALSDALGHTLPYDSADQLHARIAEANPVFATLGVLQPATWADFGKAGAVTAAPFVSPIDNYYMADPISRASETMLKCAETLGAEAERTGTDG